jgi:DNA gyrase subunit B
MKKKEYTANDIQVLEWSEAVRKRPAMYVGSTGIQGFVNILKGFFANFHSFIDSGKILDAEKISFEITDKQKGKFLFEELKTKIPSNINESPQNFDLAFDFAVLNFLSANYEFKLFDKGENEVLNQIYQRGILQTGKIDDKEYSGSKLEIEFALDSTIWDEFEIKPHFISDVIAELAFLNKNRTFELKYAVEKEECRIIYKFKNGLQDKIEIEKNKGLGSIFFDTWFEVKLENCTVEAAFGFREYSVDEPYLKSYVNNHFTHEDGTHVEGLLKGLTYGVMKHFQKHQLTQKYKISEKGIRENLVGAIHVKIKEPMFSGCVKNKLASPQIIEPIANYVSDLLFEKIELDKESTEKIIRKFQI